MPLYLISYRRTDGDAGPPAWASFTTRSDVSLDSRAIRERVDRRTRVLDERLAGGGEVAWTGGGRLDEVLAHRHEAADSVSIVYGLVTD